MITVTRSHEICAGHRIYGHEGKCARLHGHAYVVEFMCEAPGLDQIGRVIDFSVIKASLCEWLETYWDHSMVLWDNDPIVAGIRRLDQKVFELPYNPTAENLARYLVEDVGPIRLAGTGVRLIGATVHETSKCSATYTLAGPTVERGAVGWTE